MSQLVEAIGILQAVVSTARREACRHDLVGFITTYLAHQCPKRPSPMHTEIAAILQAAVRTRGVRLAVAAPRGHGKTTWVSTGFVLWCLAYRYEEFIWLVSGTETQAKILLKHVKDELETNALLRADFPGLCPPPPQDRGRGKPKPWQTGVIQLPSGASVRAFGMEQPVRGIKHRRFRPGLIIADDAENPETVRSEETRRHVKDVFSKSLLMAGDMQTNVAVVGTIAHYDSLLAELTDPAKSPAWTGKIYKAITNFPDRMDKWERWEAIRAGREQFECRSGADASLAFAGANPDMRIGATVLWPEHEDLYALMCLRADQGHSSFDSEKQNEPTDPSTCLFRPGNMRFWDDQFKDERALLEHLGPVRIHGGYDPSLGTNQGDMSAIVVVARHVETRTFYVLAADVARRTPNEAIARIVEYARMYSFVNFAVEENGFQRLLVSQLNQAAGTANVRLNVRGIRHSTDKVARISLLEPIVSQGHLVFCRKHVELLSELRQFPHAAHDDGPDALEMAIDLAKVPVPRLTVG